MGLKLITIEEGQTLLSLIVDLYKSCDTKDYTGILRECVKLLILTNLLHQETMTVYYPKCVNDVTVYKSQKKATKLELYKYYHWLNRMRMNETLAILGAPSYLKIVTYIYAPNNAQWSH